MTKHLPCSRSAASFRPIPSQPRLFGASETAQRDALTLAEGAARREAPGLVPSKTSGNLILNSGFASKASASVVSFSAEAQALARVKRLKRSVWASGHLHGLGDKGFRDLQPWFVTLTYTGVKDWKPAHIAEAMRRYRNFCKASGLVCRYTWVAELQNRGAVHYHLLAWLPRGVSMPQWDKARGRRDCFWPHGMTNTQKAVSGVGYLMKYLSKLGELTKFPKGLRLYGIGGLNAAGRSVRQWYNLPCWAKLSYGVGEVVRHGARLIVQATGEILDSPYRVQMIPGGVLCELVRALPERFHDGAYSSVSFAS